MGCNSPGSTHHRACDCREAAHAEEVARLTEIAYAAATYRCMTERRLGLQLRAGSVENQRSSPVVQRARHDEQYAREALDAALARRALAADAPAGEEEEKSNG